MHALFISMSFLACGEPSAPNSDPAPAAPTGPAAAAPASTTPAAATSRPPDMLVVVVDTLRADHLGVYGYERATSPGIDAWAAKATVFDRAYAHSGWTLTSFASLLTGLPPHEHGVGRHPMDARYFCALDDRFTTLPEALTAGGYQTAAFINNTFLAPQFGLNQGFQHWDWLGSSQDEIRSGEDTVDAALAWLDQAGDEPVFMLVHMMEPHALYDPVEPHRGTWSDATPVPKGDEIDGALIIEWQTYKSLPTPAQHARAVALYDEEIMAVDAAFTRLVAGFESRRSAAEPLVVLTSDHGEEFWEHGGFEHGQSLFGELTRVPLIVSGPGMDATRVRTVVGHADLQRGLVAKGGQPAVEGGDLFALAALGEYAGPRMVISENTLYGPPKTSIVSDEHRLVVRQDELWVSLWKVAPDTSERVQEVGPGAQALAMPLQDALARARGDLGPVKSMTEGGCRTAMEDPTVFDQLRALGYLDERPVVPSDQPIPPSKSPSSKSPSSSSPSSSSPSGSE